MKPRASSLRRGRTSSQISGRSARSRSGFDPLAARLDSRVATRAALTGAFYRGRGRPLPLRCVAGNGARLEAPGASRRLGRPSACPRDDPGFPGGRTEDTPPSAGRAGAETSGCTGTSPKERRSGASIDGGESSSHRRIRKWHTGLYVLQPMELHSARPNSCRTAMSEVASRPSQVTSLVHGPRGPPPPLSGRMRSELGRRPVHVEPLRSFLQARGLRQSCSHGQRTRACRRRRRRSPAEHCPGSSHARSGRRGPAWGDVRQNCRARWCAR